MSVTRVLAFPEGPDTNFLIDATEPYEDGLDVSEWVGCPVAHYEVRFVIDSKKYRKLFKEPPFRVPEIATRTSNIIAVALTDEASSDSFDITKRWFKYAGPARDFFNTPVRVTIEMLFPNDRLNNDAIVMTLDAKGKFVEYALNDRIN